ncbi:MAG: hypothetical protein KDJ74_18310 [Notoacmeibacter sp.]|nr:hypothetical protein [Notoacmeibacter sp.]
MDRMTKAYGEGDQDVMNMKAGIDGLVFDGWSDAEIAAAAVEMAQDSRRDLNEAIAKALSKKDDE